MIRPYHLKKAKLRIGYGQSVPGGMSAVSLDCFVEVANPQTIHNIVSITFAETNDNTGQYRAEFPMQ